MPFDYQWDSLIITTLLKVNGLEHIFYIQVGRKAVRERDGGGRGKERYYFKKSSELRAYKVNF